MLAAYQEAPEPVAAFWVHDYLSGESLRAEEATYVLGVGLMTPMGFGIAACATPEQAHGLAYGQEQAQVLDFPSLMEQVESGELDLARLVEHSGHDNDHE